MSTRQLRLNNQDEIRKRLKDFTDKKINIVMNDNTVVLGIVHSIDQSTLEVFNMRRRKIKIPIEKITEVYIDTIE